MKMSKEVTPHIINQVLTAREQLRQTGMTLTHDKKTDKLIDFKMRYKI